MAEKLPDYLIPSRFLTAPALPLTPNGKLDRKALPTLAGVELASGTEYAPPRTLEERDLAEIWQAALRRERVGIKDNFFDLGGHSLQAMAICAQAGRVFGVDLPLRMVFEHPTIEALARQLAARVKGAAAPEKPVRMVRQVPAPMSFGQQQVWLLHQIMLDPAAYNLPFAWRISGPVDPEKIQTALGEIMRRHEVLRTALVQEAEALVQKIYAAGQVELPWREMNLRALPANGREAALRDRLAAWAARPFDLAEAPLWRALWIEMAAEDHVLAFNFNHAIMDEWAERLFFHELMGLYNGGSAASLPVLPVQFADFATWQRLKLKETRFQRQADYWREQLRNPPPPLVLPADRTPPREPSSRGAWHRFQIPEPVAARLAELARRENTTLFTVMLAAYQVWLCRQTGQSDIIVGSPKSVREHPDLQNLVGYFLNTLALRARLDGASGFTAALRQVRGTVLDAFDNAGTPFEHIVGTLVRERVAGRSPLFQVMFVLLEEGLPPLRLGQSAAQPLPVETGKCKVDLILYINTDEPAWDCQLEYAADLYSADRAARWAGELRELLHSIVENPGQAIGQLKMSPVGK